MKMAESPVADYEVINTLRGYVQSSISSKGTKVRPRKSKLGMKDIGE